MQQELDSVQKQISAEGKSAPEKLYKQQKEILARARQQQDAFAAAVTHLTGVQKKESLLAVEVVRLWLWISMETVSNVLCYSYAFAANASPVRMLDVREIDDYLYADVHRQHSRHG